MTSVRTTKKPTAVARGNPNVAAVEGTRVLRDSGSVPVLHGEVSHQTPGVDGRPGHRAANIAPYAVEEQSAGGDQLLDRIQLALDAAGMVPAIGNAADIANTLVSVARGDLADAVDRAVSAVPVLGQANTARRVVKAGDQALEGAKIAKKAAAVGRAKLKPLHTDTLSPAKLESLRKLSTDELVEAVRANPLIVKQNGKVMNGNHRVKVLRERGVDVDELPRTLYESPTSEFFVDP